MLCSINEHEFVLFRDYIAEKSGIVIRPEKAYLIETRLTTLMLEAGAESFDEFYIHIKSGKDPDIKQKIINAIAVNETMWFRDAALWTAFGNEILPKLIKDITSGKKAKIRIWSAAVSTGQEIYSAVMCVDDYLSRNNIEGVDLSNFEFLATDISGRVLNIAKNGSYGKVSIMRGLNDYYKTWYFNNKDSVWDVKQSIKDAVTFELFNLQDSYEAFGIFDVIFCRYVLIYFSDEMKKDVIKKMHGSLAANGVFFTGSYVLYDLFSERFESKHYENLTYYTKKLVIR